MEHLDSLSKVLPDRPTCLTIGAFDGVHRGHQRVARRVVEMARHEGYRAAALTFHPLPRQVIGVPKPDFYLTHPKQRAELLHELGVELVITHPFDEQVREIRAADFVDMLIAHLDLRVIWVGEDFALGYRREGDLAFLRTCGEIKGFAVGTVDLNAVDGKVVISSLIRQAIRDGRVEDARRFLGRPYQLPGCVVPGDGRGREMGFPTANIQIWEEQVCPGHGVYAATVWVGPKAYGAAVNIGLRPTLTAGTRRTVEAHLLDFEGDLYGQDIQIDFAARLRDEKKFASLEHLLAQVQSDVTATRDLLAAGLPSRLR
jgi:riboflavin kinase/FMN adenylyltransferase